MDSGQSPTLGAKGRTPEICLDVRSKHQITTYENQDGPALKGRSQYKAMQLGASGGLGPKMVLWAEGCVGGNEGCRKDPEWKLWAGLGLEDGTHRISGRTNLLILGGWVKMGGWPILSVGGCK